MDSLSWFFASKVGCAPCCTTDELKMDEIKGGNLVRKTEQEAYNYSPQLPMAAATTGADVETFDVSLGEEARADTIGLEVSLTDLTVLRIEGVVAGGIAARWNESCGLHEELITGDRIVGINGQRAEGPALLDYFTKGTCRTLTIQHAEHLHVEVEKGSARKVGLGLGYCKKAWCAFLEVENLNDGLFTDWNDANRQVGGVQRGDRIIEINGLRGPPDRLLGQMKSKKLSLVFVQKAWREKLR